MGNESAGGSPSAAELAHSAHTKTPAGAGAFRLGGGELSTAENILRSARATFLEVAAAAYPQMTCDLDGIAQRMPAEEWVRDWASVEALAPGIADDIRAYCVRWGLVHRGAPAGWACSMLSELAGAWRQSKGSVRRWLFGLGGVGLPLAIDGAEWNPQYETFKSIKRRIPRGHVWAAQAVVAYHREAGLVRTPRRWARRRWVQLVRHVVEGRTYESLARETDCDDDRIENPDDVCSLKNELRALKELLGLRGLSGRPRKTR